MTILLTILCIFAFFGFCSFLSVAVFLLVWWRFTATETSDYESMRKSLLDFAEGLSRPPM